MNDQPSLFAELPNTDGNTLVFRPIRRPLWTENKAKLIERYLYYFVLITRHGAYIDGFAAPQTEQLQEWPASWAAKLVLESEPKFLRDFWLCDIDKAGGEALRDLASSQPVVRGRRVNVVEGDFNEKVHEVLASGRIRPKTAAFCLLDQRTFECKWETLKVLAGHKETNKIELFYFLATGWLDRSLAAVTVSHEKVRSWWGRDDWSELQGMNGVRRADLFCRRFRDELGYAYAYAWPIYAHGDSGSVMYHMIHCTDHVEAPKIMARAYNKATSAREPEERLQLDLERLWGPGR